MFGDQNVGEAVAIEIDGPQIWIPPVDVRLGSERDERSPLTVVSALMKAGEGPRKFHERQATVAGDIHQLLIAGVQVSRPRERSHELRRFKPSLPDVALGGQVADVPLIKPAGVLVGSKRRAIPRCRGQPIDSGRRRRRPADFREPTDLLRAASDR